MVTRKRRASQPQNELPERKPGDRCLVLDFTHSGSPNWPKRRAIPPLARELHLDPMTGQRFPVAGHLKSQNPAQSSTDENWDV